MKSDREFLDGIYVKAAEYEKNIKQSNNKQTFFQKMSVWQRKTRLQTAFGAGIALCTLLLVAGVSKMFHNSSEQKNKDNVNLSNYTLDDAGENGDTNNVSAYDLTKERTAPINTTILKAFGQITTMYEEEGSAFAGLFISRSNQKEIENQTITMSYNIEEATEDIIFGIGEEIIVFLSPDSKGSYVLTDIKENLYRLSNKEAEEKVYISSTGKGMTVVEITE